MVQHCCVNSGVDNSLRRWLQLRFDYDSTAFDHDVTTIELLVYGLLH